MSHIRLVRFGLPALSASLLAAFLGVALSPARPTQAAVVEGGKGPQLLIGRDDDNILNVDIQAGAATDQSLGRTDVIEGGPGNDVIFGLNGNDVIDGGPGSDIILGGPDGGAAPGGPPNSDIMFGGPGDDVNLWAPGDGSEAFLGGPGLDAIVFGTTDREAVADQTTGVRLPKLLFGVDGFPQGIPTANVSGQPQHCTVRGAHCPVTITSCDSADRPTTSSSRYGSAVSSKSSARAEAERSRSLISLLPRLSSSTFRRKRLQR